MDSTLLRIETVTAYMRALDRRLAEPRFTNDKQAIELRERIREFYSTAVVDDEAINDT
jgi:hypothetical protein